MRIGILGGSFDPVHNGHLVAAQDAMSHFGLAKVLFAPCNRPSHKPNALVSPKHRIAMLKTALSDHPDFEISDIDIRRGGITYSVDTVRELIGVLPGCELFFIIGSDTLPELHKWHAIHELFELCRFAVMVRPGFDPDSMREEMGLGQGIRQFLLQNTVKGREVDISSSDIRRRIARNTSISGLVHPDVEAYIAENGLYGAG